MGIFTIEKNFISTSENYDNFTCLRSPIRTLKNLEKMKTTIRRCNFTSTVEKISFSKDWQKERVEHCFSPDDNKLKCFPTAPKKIARTDKTVLAVTDGDGERDAVSVLS